MEVAQLVRAWGKSFSSHTSYHRRDITETLLLWRRTTTNKPDIGLIDLRLGTKHDVIRTSVVVVHPHVD